MPTTTGFSFGDVVLVPFPFTDQTATKKRPSLPKPPLVKPVFATIERRLVLRKLGALRGPDREKLREAIRQALG